MQYPTIEDTIGNTPLVQLIRMPGEEAARRNNVILGKLEGNNPAGSVKDRPAMSMIKGRRRAWRYQAWRHLDRGDQWQYRHRAGDGRIDARLQDDLAHARKPDLERRQSMAAYGAQIVLTPKTGGMEYARDLAEQMQKEGQGIILDQFANPDNPRSHYESTGPEIWRDTDGQVTHFVSAMGTTGTIMGVSHYLKEKNEAIRIIGAQPEEDRNSRHTEMAGSLLAEDFRPFTDGPGREREPDCCRAYGAEDGSRGRDFLRDFCGGRLRGCTAYFTDSRECHDRFYCMRPW